MGTAQVDKEHPGLSIAWGTRGNPILSSLRVSLIPALGEGGCGHIFHLDCIKRWLRTRSVCPLCNRSWEMTKVSLTQVTAASLVVLVIVTAL